MGDRGDDNVQRDDIISDHYLSVVSFSGYTCYLPHSPPASHIPFHNNDVNICVVMSCCGQCVFGHRARPSETGLITVSTQPLPEKYSGEDAARNSASEGVVIPLSLLHARACTHGQIYPHIHTHNSFRSTWKTFTVRKYKNKILTEYTYPSQDAYLYFDCLAILPFWLEMIGIGGGPILRCVQVCLHSGTID